jgi:hypothetical protein
MRPDTFQTISLTASGIACTGPCAFGGALIGDIDGVNDMTVTIYDGITAAGTEVMPTTIFDGTVKGLEGIAENRKVQCTIGIYVAISGAGTLKVTVRYKPIG